MGDYRLNYNHPRMDQIASTNHYEFEPTRNDSTYSGNSYYFPNTIGSSSGLWNQQGVRSNLVRRAMEEDHSKGLERFSQYQNPEIANMVLEEVSESIFELMTDHYGHKLYEKLIERCEDYHLARIVNKLTLQSNALVGASFMKYGSYSIQVLIKRVKGSEWAKLVTTNLSMPKAFCDLMRNKHGRHVVNPCFFKLDTWTNRVLFEAAIEHCVELAMDPVGDVSIIDCINSVRIPEQKKLLLQRISTNSLRLSFDTSGTFVVQHILELGNELFSDTICCHLKGKYVMLSQLQCGNFVVEKCLRASKLGLRYFVEDISHNEDILKKLARDKFGNYVIQTALEISKEACLFFSSARTLLSAILMNFL